MKLHVSASVFGMNSANVQLPGALMIVRDAESANSGHHLSVDGEDHLPVQMHPRHLRTPHMNQRTFHEGKKRLNIDLLYDFPSCQQRS